MAKIALITGSRDWPLADSQSIFDRLDDEHFGVGPIDVIVTGMARGVDTICHRWAHSRGIGCDEYPADWDNPLYRTPTGKSFAGNVRNQQMLDDTFVKYGKYPDKCIAFHRNLQESRGTRDMVKKAMKVGVPVEFYP